MICCYDIKQKLFTLHASVVIRRISYDYNALVRLRHYVGLSDDGDDNISGDLLTWSTDNIRVTGRPTLNGSIVIRRSLLKPTDKSYGRSLATLGLDHSHTAQHVSNVFDGGYLQTRQNPLYSSDSEQLDDGEDHDDHSW